MAETQPAFFKCGAKLLLFFDLQSFLQDFLKIAFFNCKGTRIGTRSSQAIKTGGQRPKPIGRCRN
jgi:hypothetical protein